ncbi:MAG: hypothetical protein IIY16_02500 [Oscillospiraceae bacterium]|nr:hypothetical protein [Oscillospiraceae bacterium]
MKRIAVILLVLIMLLSLLAGCGKTKILHCDHCGEEVEVEADSNMEEDWIVYCGKCNEELFGDDPLLAP